MGKLICIVLNEKYMLFQARPHKPQKTEVEVLYRSPYLKKLVKMMANGICQMCGKKAPFYDKNREPYLEEHHVMQLAKGGSDTMDNVVAICPNCHRRVHVLKKEEDIVILEKKAKQNNNEYQGLLAYIEKLQKEHSVKVLEEEIMRFLEMQNTKTPN